jgi:plasmid stability protein
MTETIAPEALEAFAYRLALDEMERRRRLSAAMKGRTFTDEHREGLRRGWVKRKAASAQATAEPETRAEELVAGGAA